MPAVGQQAVGDPDQDEDEAGRERDVAEPVDLGRCAHPPLLELRVGEEGAEDPEGHRDQEDEVPLDRRQHAAEDEPDERTGDGRRVVDAQTQAPLISGERVGDDGRGVGEEHGAADALADAHGDEPDGGRRAGEPGHGQKERERGEDDEAEVEDLDPAEDVADPAEGDHQHGEHHA